MKSNTKIKIVFLIVLGIVFSLLTIFNSNLNFNTANSNKTTEYSDDIYTINENLKISKISGKIHITNNSGWLDFRNADNCTGSGIYSDPYVIEDLIIDGGGSGMCIWIEYSDVYFRIENCTIYNSGYNLHDAGIKLLHVDNSQLIDNNCSSNYMGIYLDFSNNNTVSGNIANNNTFNGIYIHCSNNNILSGNTAHNNYGISTNGISIESSNNNTILENTANDNDEGITLKMSHNNTLSRNTANNNDFKGIRLMVSNNNNISRNTASYNKEGISLAESDNNTISENIANNNEWYGVYLYMSEYNTVSGNTLIGNDKCIEEFNCEGNIFENNDCGDGNQGLPGYGTFFLIGIISIISIILILLERRKQCKS